MSDGPAPFDPTSIESQLALLCGYVEGLVHGVNGDILRPGGVDDLRKLLRSLPYYKGLRRTREDSEQ